jgi:uridine phosphorylase
MMEKLESKLGKGRVFPGADCTADSFYSSQGRIDKNFDDCNENLIDNIRIKNPECEILQMESSMLFHLAQVCSAQAEKDVDHPGGIRAASCAMVFFNRITNESIDVTSVENLEFEVGKILLETLITTVGKADETKVY